MAEAFGAILIFAIVFPLLYYILSGVLLSFGLYNIFLVTSGIALFAVMLFVMDIWGEQSRRRATKQAALREKAEQEKVANEARLAVAHQSGRAKLLTQIAEMRRYIGNMRSDKDNTQALLLVDNVIDRIRSDDDINHNHLSDNVARLEIDGLISYFQENNISQSTLLVHRLKRLCVTDTITVDASKSALHERKPEEQPRNSLSDDEWEMEWTEYRIFLSVIVAAMAIILVIFAIVSGWESKKAADYERCIANNGWFCSRHL